jgi:hypothetical protein
MQGSRLSLVWACKATLAGQIEEGMKEELRIREGQQDRLRDHLQACSFNQLPAQAAERVGPGVVGSTVANLAEDQLGGIAESERPPGKKDDWKPED